MLHVEPEYTEITAETLEHLEKFREEHAGDEMGTVAQTVLFEDEKVRIWEMKLAPGEHSDLHHHAHAYYLVIMSGDFVAGVPPKSSGMDIFAVRIPPEGNTVAIPKGGTEWAYNIGETTYHEILIELKDS
jgi:mannose-6-phosphate isomerase-like protein (cupin superfamily)